MSSNTPEYASKGVSLLLLCQVAGWNGERLVANLDRRRHVAEVSVTLSRKTWIVLDLTLGRWSAIVKQNRLPQNIGRPIAPTKVRVNVAGLTQWSQPAAGLGRSRVQAYERALIREMGKLRCRHRATAFWPPPGACTKTVFFPTLERARP